MPERRAGDTSDLLPCPPDCEDSWWPASDDATPLVNEVSLMVAHHHATGHNCGGGGFSADCEDCDFAIEDGVVVAGGWVRFTKEEGGTDATSPALSHPAPSRESQQDTDRDLIPEAS